MNSKTPRNCSFTRGLDTGYYTQCFAFCLFSSPTFYDFLTETGQVGFSLSGGGVDRAPLRGVREKGSIDKTINQPS